MMKNRYIHFFAAIAAFTVLAVSCMNPLNSPSNNPPSNTITTTEGAGRVVLTVSTGEVGSTRTILPVEPPSFSRYELEFTKGNETVSVADTSTIAGTGVSHELAAGTWTASVNAYRTFTPTGGSTIEYLAAQGSTQVTVSEGQFTPVTVFIAPVPIIGSTVKGIFTYTISFPNGVSGTLRIGNEAPTALTSGQTVSLELDPSYYDLFISLTDENDQVAGAAQKAHIYSGLESKAIYVFTSADFGENIFGEAGSGTLLTYNTWMNGNITTEEQVDWYKLTASTTATYYLQWDDAYNGGNKTLKASVSAYRGGEGWTELFNNWSSDYTISSMDINAGETVYVRVAPDWNNVLGTYAIQYQYYDPTSVLPQTAPKYVRVEATPVPTYVVTWEDVLGATGYTVYRSTSADGSYDHLETINGEQTTYYIDTAVSPETTYYYKVSAINSNGEGSLSAAFSDTPLTVGTGTPLTDNTWTDGNITTAEQVDWYKITAATTAAYSLQWDDAYNSEGSKTLVAYISAYRGDGSQVFIYWSGSYASLSVYLNAGETMYVRVYSVGNTTGTYAIRCYQVIDNALAGIWKRTVDDQDYYWDIKADGSGTFHTLGASVPFSFIITEDGRIDGNSYTVSGNTLTLPNAIYNEESDEGFDIVFTKVDSVPSGSGAAGGDSRLHGTWTMTQDDITVSLTFKVDGVWEQGGTYSVSGIWKADGNYIYVYGPSLRSVGGGSMPYTISGSTFTIPSGDSDMVLTKQ
jgi:hypothetical protein